MQARVQSERMQWRRERGTRSRRHAESAGVASRVRSAERGERGVTAWRGACRAQVVTQVCFNILITSFTMDLPNCSIEEGALVGRPSPGPSRSGACPEPGVPILNPKPGTDEQYKHSNPTVWPPARRRVRRGRRGPCVRVKLSRSAADRGRLAGLKLSVRRQGRRASGEADGVAGDDIGAAQAVDGRRAPCWRGCPR